MVKTRKAEDFGAVERHVVEKLRQRFESEKATLGRGEIAAWLQSLGRLDLLSRIITRLEHRGLIQAAQLIQRKDKSPALKTFERRILAASGIDYEITPAVCDDLRNGGGEGGKGEATGGKHSPTKLRPCDKKAFSQYEHAIEKEPSIVSDDEAYDWLVEDLRADGISLTRRDNWKRYVGRARTHYGKQKNGPRIGNETHSVVSATRLDTPKRTKADQR